MAPSGAAVATEYRRGGATVTAPGKPAPKPTSQGARRDIQGLRAVAVIVVILDHLVAWPSGGFIGVDVFFVLSGFLITGLLLREHDRTGRISIAEFYRRRARRILPVSWLVLGLTVLAAFLLFAVVRFQSTAVDAFWALVFGVNWHMAIQGTDYMQAAGPVSPVQHFWSLAVEEQFYLFWPLLIILALVLTRAATGRRRSNSEAGLRLTRRGVAIVAGIVVVASFAWSMYESTTSPTFAYFSTFSRAWELGLGALLASVAARFTRIPAALRVVMAWIGIVGIAVSLFLLTPESTFPAPWAALPVLATVLVVASGIGTEARFTGVLTNPVSRYLGDISYSLYLWHFPVIIFTATLLPIESPWTIALVLAIILGLSAYSYHFIEDPIRRSQWLEPRWRRRAGTSLRPKAWFILGWLAGIAVVSLAFTTFAVTAGATIRTPPPSILVQAEAPAGADEMTLGELRTAEIATALSATTWPATDPALDTLDKNAGAQEWVVDECLNIYSNVRDSCIYGDPNAEKLAVMLGDSTAVSYLPGLIGPLTDAGYRLQVLTMFSCPAWDIAVGPVGSEAARVCDLQHDWVYDYTARLQPDLVLMSSLAGTVVKLASGTDIEPAVREYGTAASETIARLAPSVGEIVVISPPPAQEKPVTECKTPTSRPSDCIAEASALYRAVVSAERAAVDANAGEARYIDVTSWLCNGTACPSFIGTAPVSWDGIHLTDKAAEALGPLFAQTLFPEDAETAEADG